MDFGDYVQSGEPHEKIWRYMDFEKFLYLLQKRSLYFCALKNFRDKYEGSVRMMAHMQQLDLVSDLGQEMIKLYNHPRGPRAYIVASCWHLNEYESAAMWQLYSNGGKGIAIQSTIGRLRGSLKSIPELEKDMKMGKVNYHIIPDPEPGHGQNVDLLPFFKRSSFDYEREYRVTTHARALNENRGEQVSVDLTTLIEAIYIAPELSAWTTDMVSEILKKYELPIEVKRSDIDDDPLI